MKKRILSLALALCLGVGLMPATALAAAEPIGRIPDVFQGDGLYITATPWELQASDGWYVPESYALVSGVIREGMVQVWKDVQAVDSSGYYTGSTYQRIGYADRTGKLVLTFDDWETPPVADKMRQQAHFSEGMCIYRDLSTGLYGYINTQGEPVIPAQYTSVTAFSDGLAEVTDEQGSLCYIDSSGNTVLGPFGGSNGSSSPDIGIFGNGLASYRGWLDGDYFVGFIDKQGNPAITIYRGEDNLGYDEDEDLSLTQAQFSEGYAILEDNRGGRTRPGYVIIDTQGNEVGVIDAEPPCVIEFQVSRLFHDGLVIARYVDTSTGLGASRSDICIWDVNGSMIARLPYKGKSYNGSYAYFDSGVAVIDNYEVIDGSGNRVIPGSDQLVYECFGKDSGTITFISDFDQGLSMLRVLRTSESYYLLEVHQGTYTGPGLVYNAATGTIRDGAATPAQPAGDAPSSWAAEQVNEAIAAGIVPEALQGGYTAPITRAEFCALAVELCETVKGTEITQRTAFTDTDDLNVQKMAGLGVVLGTGDGTFNPGGQLTREQAATMLSRLSSVMGHPLPAGTADFTDGASIAAWAVEAVGQMQSSGIMGGTGGGAFTPQGTYTREQSILTILRLYELTQS